MSDVDAHTPMPVGPPLPYVNARVHAIDCEFLLPYLEPFGCFVDRPEDADLLLAMNSVRPGATQALSEARRWHKPLAWWTIEDPNAFESFLPQAQLVDFVFTTDLACIPSYVARLGHDRVFWLPLACSPAFHHPLAPVEGASDFVISANWYQNQARLWGVETVVEPLWRAGHSLTLFCYAAFMWPPQYRGFWRGETSCRTVAEQYRHGRVVLGLNNQRSGMDGRDKTYMTSMRTFEALACGKPFLAAHSDAYERLGFIQGEHMAWVERPEDTLAWAERLLGAEGLSIARQGRDFVLARHTYAHRLASLAEAVLG
jgi:spore maturation protein CgeB